MLFSSPVYSQVSGSIAGITYFHGRSGLTTRARSTPTNPNSARQRIIRYAIAEYAGKWGQTLTAVERAAWNLYASNVPWVNALGQTIFLTGQQHFTRTNVITEQGSIGFLAAAPTIYDLGTFTAPTLTVAATVPVPRANIAFDNTDDWATTVGGYMLISMSRSVGPGHAAVDRNFHFQARVDGAVIPPATPAAFNVDWRWGAGNLTWAKIRFVQADNRISNPIILGPHTIT